MTGEQRFRSAVASYVVLGGIFGGMFAFSVYATIFTHSSFWKAAVSFGLAFIVVIVWLATFEIRITGDELVFRSLFAGVRRIRHHDIRKIRLGFRLRQNAGPLRLSVEPKNRELPTMSINAKVFTSKAIRAVLDLGERLATADSGELEDGVVMRSVRRKGGK